MLREGAAHDLMGSLHTRWWVRLIASIAIEGRNLVGLQPQLHKTDPFVWHTFLPPFGRVDLKPAGDTLA
jgi:hypothetical protein